MTLALNSISGDLWNPTVDVSGVVSDTNATIYVNGVQGTNNGDGTWTVARVPVSPSGVASFDLKAIPLGGDDPDGNTNVEKAAEITMDGVTWSNHRSTHFYTDPEPYAYLQDDLATWDWVGATKSGMLREVWDRNHNDPGDGTAVFPIDENGVLAGGHYEVQSNSTMVVFDVDQPTLHGWVDPDTGYISTWGNGPSGAWDSGNYYNDWLGTEQKQGALSVKGAGAYDEWTEERTGEPRWLLHTGGRSGAGGESIFALTADVKELKASGGSIVDGDSVPPQQVAINGRQQGT